MHGAIFARLGSRARKVERLRREPCGGMRCRGMGWGSFAEPGTELWE